MKTLTLAILASLAFTHAASAAQPIPEFQTGKGKSYRMQVGPAKNSPGLLRVWISEWQRSESSFTGQMKARGYQVEGADTIEFLIPASACVSKDNTYINCDSDRLTTEERALIVVSLYESGRGLNGPVLRFAPSELQPNGMSVKFATHLVKTSAIGQNGNISEEILMGFSSSVWLYQSKGMNGWFGHAVEGMDYYPGR